MKTVLLLLYIAVLVAFMFAIAISMPKKLEQRIDCSMASFHPDYTAEMRKACNTRFIKQ